MPVIPALAGVHIGYASDRQPLHVLVAHDGARQHAVSREFPGSDAPPNGRYGATHTGRSFLDGQ
jgi:hypothetical protein